MFVPMGANIRYLSCERWPTGILFKGFRLSGGSLVSRAGGGGGGGGLNDVRMADGLMVN